MTFRTLADPMFKQFWKDNKEKDVWNHRIVLESDHGGDPVFEVREVYYDVEGKPYAHGRAYVMGETFEEVHEVFERMRTALGKPTLRYPDDFTGDANLEIDE
jgi:hypothetical protein